jgi:hypothetical protein
MQMMKTANDRSEKSTWLGAITEAAKLQGLTLPAFDGVGMGALRSEMTRSGRFITVKRRIAPADQAEIDGVEWALWREQDDLTIPVAGFREPLRPSPENVGAVLAVLKGWLVDDWTPDEAKAAVSKHPRAFAIQEPPALSGCRS